MKIFINLLIKKIQKASFNYITPDLKPDKSFLTCDLFDFKPKISPSVTSDNKSILTLDLLLSSPSDEEDQKV